jgi:hypothetical protein
VKLITNVGDHRVIDELRAARGRDAALDIASPGLSLFAFGEAKGLFEKIARCRLVIPLPGDDEPQLFGSDADRPFRNRLETRALSRQFAAWIDKKVELRGAPMSLPQALFTIGSGAGMPSRVLTGNCAFSTDGLGLTPGNRFSLIQCAESREECELLVSWFDSLWSSLPATQDAKNGLLARLHELTAQKAPSLIY